MMRHTLKWFFAFVVLAGVACAQAVLTLPWNEQPFVCNNGQACANGFVYTYQSGTLTPLNSFTDYTGGVANSNPIQLNGLGFPTCSGVQCAIWLTANLPYRVCLQNAAHVQQYCVDGVQATTPAFVSCGQTSTCSNTIIPQGLASVIYGFVPLISGTPSTAVVSGITAFANTAYGCVATDTTNAANDLLKTAVISASSFSITGPNTITDVIFYICVGQ